MAQNYSLRNYHFITNDHDQQNNNSKPSMNQYQQNAEIYKFNRNQKDSSQVKHSFQDADQLQNGLDYMIYKDQANKYISCKYPSISNQEAEKIIQYPKEDKYKFSVKTAAYPRNLTTRDITDAIPGTLKSKVVQNFEKHHMMNDNSPIKQIENSYELANRDEFQPNQMQNQSPLKNITQDDIKNLQTTPNKIDAPYPRYGKKYNFNEDFAKQKLYDKFYIQEVNQKLPDKIISHQEEKSVQNPVWDDTFKQRYPKNSQDLGVNSKTINTEGNNLRYGNDRLNRSAIGKRGLVGGVDYTNSVQQGQQYERSQHSGYLNQEGSKQSKEMSPDEIKTLINQYERGFSSKQVNKYQQKNYDIINFFNKESWRNDKNPNYVKIQSFPKTNIFVFQENPKNNMNTPERRLPSRGNKNYQFYSEQKQKPYLEQESINDHTNNEYDKFPKINNSTNKSYDSHHMQKYLSSNKQSYPHNDIKNFYGNDQQKVFNSNNNNNNEDILDQELRQQSIERNKVTDFDQYKSSPYSITDKKRSVSVNHNSNRYPAAIGEGVLRNQADINNLDRSSLNQRQNSLYYPNNKPY